MAFITSLMGSLGLSRRLAFASDLNIHGGKTERLVRICEYFQAKTFLEGAAGKSYIDGSLFEAHDIRLKYQVYKHPVYHQLYGDFIPYMSVIDLVFNHGKESLRILVDRDRSS